MKNYIVMRIFVVACMLVVAVGCASTSTKEGTGEYFDDSAITAKVKAELLQEPKLKSTDITVETFKGVVQLSGFVDSLGSAHIAGEVARKVGGVKGVRNDLHIKGQQ